MLLSFKIHEILLLMIIVLIV